jgi:hypothetical protein
MRSNKTVIRGQTTEDRRQKSTVPGRTSEASHAKKTRMIQAFGCQPNSAPTTWWSWRGCPTRSHPELDRETPQRQWYCVLRRGRVGRRQVFRAENRRQKTEDRDQIPRMPPKTHSHRQNTNNRNADNPSDPCLLSSETAGWSSPVARQAHNLKVAGSNPAPATNKIKALGPSLRGFIFL